MERYSEYKDSGVKWLGEIPSHWEVMPIKYISEVSSGATPKTSVQGYWDGNITWVTPADFKTETKFVLKGNRNITTLGVKSCSTVILPKGSLVFSKRAPIGQVSILKIPLCTNQGCFGIIPNESMNNSFLYYSLAIHAQSFNTLGSGTTFRELSFSTFSSFKISVPPKEEQDAIVRYLDAATSKIDKAIAMQQKMIDLLNERKQIIIQNAVTKGLDENVEMKDSGVEWIGMIPKHWKIIRIKHLAKLQSGSNLTSNEISDTGSYPVYGGNGLRGFYGSYNCEGSYVLIGRQGALCGNINYAEDKFWATEHAVVCYPKKKYNTLWFGEVLRLMDLGQYSLASAQPGLAVERIKGLYMPYPSIEEQNKIALFLKQNIGKIDLYARHCQRQIALLQERKQIIINEVVTGKVKVS